LPALSHLRILDLTRILAGPWASQLLGDLGADILKIERPGTGDDTRAWGPPYLPDTTDAGYFLCANRNKRSVAIDFTRPEGADLVRRLAADSDVVIENFKVGGLAKYGLDHAALCTVNPDLITCSITGYGQTGPYADRPGYDFVMQGLGGLMSITGRPDGEPGAGPQRVGVALTDVMTGLYACTAILAALAHRDRTGHGQHIDLALLDVQVATLANQTSNFLMTGQAPTRMGNAHPNIVPYQDFPSADGHLLIAVGNDSQFARLADALGEPGWATDPRYATNAARVANRAVLVPAIAAITAARGTADWVAVLEAAGVPCGPINNLAQVFADPQVQARGTRIAMTHGTGAELGLVANPIRMSGTPVTYRLPPPTLGEHTAATLRDRLGLSVADIQTLTEKGIIA
jgi:crotonobetainyl-CoA:carnitine CoA-transferase CaiB-like acyl-CoA transferase